MITKGPRKRDSVIAGASSSPPGAPATKLSKKSDSGTPSEDAPAAPIAGRRDSLKKEDNSSGAATETESSDVANNSSTQELQDAMASATGESNEKPGEKASLSITIPEKKQLGKSSKSQGPGSITPTTKKKKGRPPKLDASSRSNSAANLLDSDGNRTPLSTKGGNNKSSTAQDQHPYARSAVIEVWHGVEDPSENSWWSEESDEEGYTRDMREEVAKEPPKEDATDTRSAETKETSGDSEEGEPSLPPNLKRKMGVTPSVRLCDIIDRVATDDGQWRYYVHYKDFNRRMDEWVSMARIVSPPSVGNSKARAIKKEEERQKRKQAREEEKKAEPVIDVTAPRASRRRSIQSLTSLEGAAGAPNAPTTAVETPRTRTRRKSIADDDATVVTGNAEGAGESEAPAPAPPLMAAEKGIVALPTAAVHTTAVGEHIVETIVAQEMDEHEGLDEASLREHEEVTKVKNVAFLELGAFQMETWYFSPLPKELLSERGLIEVLYVCEFSLGLFSRKSELQRFQKRLPVHARHPPGNEIYRKGNLAMFEVDGFEERIYCQNLCYIAKLFLDHKTLYFDVDPFLFYVLCEVDDRGFHPVGYYSKEKYSDVGYNLACILTFPCHQRKGYGRFLISFSYELSKKEEKVGSPEKPMSDLGQQAYKPYWASTIIDFLLNQQPEASNMSIMDISKVTSIMAEDIVFTLNQLGILKLINGVYFIAAEEGMLRTLAKKNPVKEPRVDPSKLHWSPFLTDVKRDKFSIHSKKPSVEGGIADVRGSGGFP